MRVPTYTTAERDRRWAIARGIMKAHNLQALIAYGEHESADLAPFAPDAYFTNDRPGSIVIFVGDADPVQLVWSNMSIQDHIEARRRGDALWLEPKNISVGKNADGIVRTLRAAGLEQAAVGVLGLDPYPPFHINPIMPHVLWTAVTAALPDVTFTQVGMDFMFATFRQSEEELAVVRHSAAIGDEMARAMLQAAAPGVTEAELYAAGMVAAFQLGAAAPDMLLSTGPGFISWGPPAWSYRPQASRVLEEGDVILAEVFNRFGMKETQHQVAIAIGEPHPDILAAAEIARAAYEAGLKAAVPGTTFGDVVAAMTAPLTAADSWNIHPLVHALNPLGPVGTFGAGLSRIPEAAEYGGLGEIPTIGAQLPLQPGMTFAFEPNAVVGRSAVNLGGTVVIGEQGAIELNAFTAQLLRA